MSQTLPFSKLSPLEKLSIFSRNHTDFLNMDAIYADETPNYVQPERYMPGQTITLYLRTAKDNADYAYCYVWDGVSGYTRMMMKKATDEKKTPSPMFDYYVVEFLLGAESLNYYFSVFKRDKEYFYNKRGLYPNVEHYFNFKLIPAFFAPEWAMGAVMYQILVDRFYNGDPTNDIVSNEYTYLGNAATFVDDWHKPITNNADFCNFYGGDLQGVIEKLPYLQDLGIEVIYFCPIFVSPSLHKYDIQDYDYVDPHYGRIVEDGGEPLRFEKFHNRFATKYMQRTTNKANLEASNALLVELIEKAHQFGMRVIIDGVFNHCGSYNKWMDKSGFYFSQGYPVGAYRDEKSVYHDYFKWYDKNWPNNDCYMGWWGHENHPKLNYEGSQELYDYIMDVAKKWVSPPFNADGWRLDVAADLGFSREFNHQFWRDFRTAVKEANPEAIIISEHYGDTAEWLAGNEWDTVMNYDAFMNPLTWFLTGMEKHSEEFRGDMLNNAMAFESTMRGCMAQFSMHSLYTAMNELSNHDHSRFLTRTNMQVGRFHTHGKEAADTGINKNIMMEAVLFQMLWPGSPTIYYGDEAGVTGWTDPDNRRVYPWGREDQLMLRFHKDIIAIRKRFPMLKRGSLEYLYCHYGVLSFGRWDENDRIVFALNNNKNPLSLRLPVWKAECGPNGKMETLIVTGNDSYNTDAVIYKVENGYLDITLPAYGGMALREV